jgi:hypothetical protein
MIDRRGLLGAGVAAGVIGALNASADAEPAAALQRPDMDTERIARVLEQLRDVIRAERLFGELDAVRAAQQTFLRANGKFPDFIEVGVGVWFAVHDWHVRWQQPLQIGRDPTGRYMIRLLETAVILRTETQDNFIGIPYDTAR